VLRPSNKRNRKSLRSIRTWAVCKRVGRVKALCPTDLHTHHRAKILRRSRERDHSRRLLLFLHYPSLHLCIRVQKRLPKTRVGNHCRECLMPGSKQLNKIKPRCHHQPCLARPRLRCHLRQLPRTTSPPPLPSQPFLTGVVYHHQRHGQLCNRQSSNSTSASIRCKKTCLPAVITLLPGTTRPYLLRTFPWRLTGLNRCTTQSQCSNLSSSPSSIRPRFRMWHTLPHEEVQHRMN
jgi:hypothetical protein